MEQSPKSWANGGDFKEKSKAERGNYRVMAGAWESSGSILKFLALGGALVPNMYMEMAVPLDRRGKVCGPFPFVVAGEFPGTGGFRRLPRHSFLWDARKGSYQNRR
jgi:hypothetical protein